MNLWSTEGMAVILGGVIALGFVLSRLQGRAAAGMIHHMAGDLEAVTRASFQRTGYEHAALRGAPLAEQVAHSMAMVGQIETATHLVRTRTDLEQHFEQSARAAGGGGARFRARWWTPARPRFGVHIADRRLSSLAQQARDLFTELVRDFRPRYPHEITLRNPALAARFRVWTDHPAAAEVALDDPALAEALLALSLVDLATLDTQISIADPLMETLAASGSFEQRVRAMEAGHDAAWRLLWAARRVFAPGPVPEPHEVQAANCT